MPKFEVPYSFAALLTLYAPTPGEKSELDPVNDNKPNASHVKIAVSTVRTVEVNKREGAIEALCDAVKRALHECDHITVDEWVEEFKGTVMRVLEQN